MRSLKNLRLAVSPSLLLPVLALSVGLTPLAAFSKDIPAAVSLQTSLPQTSSSQPFPQQTSPQKLPPVFSSKPVIEAVDGQGQGQTQTGQPQSGLSLEQALRQAVQSNPDFRAIRVNAAISDAQIVTAAARLNPSVMSDNGIAEDTYRLGVEQVFELGGKRKKRVAVAEAQKKKTLADINVKLLELRGNVRKAYTTLYIAQEREKAYAAIQEDTQQLLTIADKRERAGDIAKMDVLSAKISYTRARNDYQTAIYQVIEAKNQLGRLLYTPVSAILAVEPPTQFNGLPATPAAGEEGALHATVTHASLPDQQALIDLALTQRPELASNEFDRVQNESRLAVSKANRIPNLRLAAGPDMVTTPGSRTLNMYVMGGMEVPLFNRQQGPIQEALARQQQLQVQRDAIRNDVTFDVISAYNAFVGNQERLKVYETELLPDASHIVRLAQLSFREGKTPILTPLNAQQAYVGTRLGYLEALNSYQNSITDLENAIGAGL